MKIVRNLYVKSLIKTRKYFQFAPDIRKEMQRENDSNMYFRVKIIYFLTGTNSLQRQEAICFRFR